jgi:pimeloyl-ACP methyl ester carboxylesterase
MSRRIIVDELEFDVAYGKLAAKTWHEETDECKRVLLLHGWMDNAGSFDNMVPKLKHKDGLYIVALDLPGHGKSSQFPPGSSYSDMNIVMEIRRCLTELKWIQPVPRKLVNGEGSPKPGGGRMITSASQNSIASMNDSSGKQQKKFTIIGHSLGGGLALFYASLYPNDVDDVISLDFIKARSPPIHDLLQDTAETIDQFIETVPSQSPFSSPVLSKSSASSNHPANRQADKGQVVVSQEAAIVATIEAHRLLGVLTREDATCLLKRSTVAVSTPPNSVIYSRDLRLQSMLNLRENIEIHKVMFNRVSCNVLIIVGKFGMYGGGDEFYTDKMDEVIQFYKERARNLRVQWINADHYLHMNRPQETAEFINAYLEDPAAFKEKAI